MHDSSPASTPMAIATKLDKDTSESMDMQTYRGMIGSLLYFTTSRPEIMFATYLCVIFQADPREPHLMAVKIFLISRVHQPLVYGTLYNQTLQ